MKAESPRQIPYAPPIGRMQERTCSCFHGRCCPLESEQSLEALPSSHTPVINGIGGSGWLLSKQSHRRHEISATTVLPWATFDTWRWWCWHCHVGKHPWSSRRRPVWPRCISRMWGESSSTCPLGRPCRIDGSGVESSGRSPFHQFHRRRSSPPREETCKERRWRWFLRSVVTVEHDSSQAEGARSSWQPTAFSTC